MTRLVQISLLSFVCGLLAIARGQSGNARTEVVPRLVHGGDARQVALSGSSRPIHRIVVGRRRTEEAEVVYRNRRGAFAFAPSGQFTGDVFGDDIVTLAAAGCLLDRYAIRVIGDLDNDDAPKRDYTVTFALHETCPTIDPTPILGSGASVVIPAKLAGDLVEIEFRPTTEVELPQSFYLSVRFDREECGIVIGAPPTIGFSGDRFDFPAVSCFAGLGGYPAAPHASFFSEFFVRTPCPSNYPVFRTANDGRQPFSPGPAVPFGQELALSSQTCNLTAYEVMYGGEGTINVRLTKTLDDNDPYAGEEIPGSRFSVSSELTETNKLARHDLDFPVPVTSPLFVVFDSSTSESGPELTALAPILGSVVSRYYYVHNGSEWEEQGGQFRYFSVTLYCDGIPAVGQCCNVGAPSQFVCAAGASHGQSCDPLDDEACGGGVCVGVAECAELPEMNCPNERWFPGETCSSNSFIPECGIGACCKPDGSCEDLTKADCFSIEPFELDRVWDANSFCASGGFECPLRACEEGQGVCEVAHLQPGCEDPRCCTAVCEFDAWCCENEWDAVCVRIASDLCWDLHTHDTCENARPVSVGTTTIISTSQAYDDSADPGFCCHSDRRQSRGENTVWFTFEATHPTVGIAVYAEEPSELDPLVALYQSHDNESPCSTLGELACGDDNYEQFSGALASLSFDSLVSPGRLKAATVGRVKTGQWSLSLYTS